jgi:hypothetical protein
MIHKFRTLYPQGSLISELIKIDCGKYLVKASIQVDGVTLTTGLAAADTIELAEDRARQRALEALALDAIVAQETKPSPSSTTETTETSIAESQEEIIEAIEETPVVPAAKKTRREKKKSTETSEIIEKESTSPQNEPSKTLNTLDLATEEVKEIQEVQKLEKGNRDREELVTSWLGQTEDIEENVPDVFDRESWIESDRSDTESYTQETEEAILEKQGSLFDEPTTSNFTETASTSKTIFSTKDNENQTSQKSSTVAFDDDEHGNLTAKTTVEMKRLGWTTQQGRDFLIATYGKQSRMILTNQELEEFLAHLQSQPTP